MDERGEAVGFSKGENEVTGRKERTSAAFEQLRCSGPGTGVQALGPRKPVKSRARLQVKSMQWISSVKRKS